MRGSPLLRALIALVFMLGLAWPLQRLLRPAPVEAAPSLPTPKQGENAPLQTVELQVDFTVPPQDFQVLASQKEVWAEAAPTASISRSLALTYPAEGIDLVFNATWPTNVTGAARVRFTAPDGAETVSYLWSQGPLRNEVLSFK